MEALRGVALVLRGVAGALQGAYLVEGVQQSGVQIQEPDPVLEHGRQRPLQRQLAAPSAASPSSLRI